MMYQIMEVRLLWVACEWMACEGGQKDIPAMRQSMPQEESLLPKHLMLGPRLQTRRRPSMPVWLGMQQAPRTQSL